MRHVFFHIFLPKKSAFFKCFDKSIEVCIQTKKSGCSLPKNGYWTPKMPVEHQFAHKNHKEDILLARFHQRKIFRVSKPLSANSFKYDIEENCFSGFWRCFLGQIPVIWWVTPTSFSLKRFFSLFVTQNMDLSGEKMRIWL